jgi:flagellar basal-body rod protein FlgB
MTQQLFNSGAIQSLERLVQFTGARHRVISDNIANLSTPYFRPKDLDVKAFQRNLKTALDRRREATDPAGQRLEMTDTRELEFHDDGLTATPKALNENILFHDRNNRDLERIMQDLAENTMAHNAGLQLLKSEFDMLKLAISERV